MLGTTGPYSDFSGVHVESEGNLDDLMGSLYLRYKTYCLEKKFLGDEFSNEMEMDHYDSEKGLSDHFAVRNSKLNDQIVGTARLIVHREDMGLPTEKLFPDFYKAMKDKVGAFDIAQVNELSRLCIDERFRRRKEPLDEFYGLESYMMEDPNSRRKYPIIFLHLFRKIFQVSKKQGVKYWVASLEDTLRRFLNMYGVECIPLIDGYIEFYGQVKPVVVDVDKTLDVIAKQRHEVYTFFTTP